MDLILAFIGFIVVISVVVIRISERFKVPILIIYIGLGVALGPYGMGFIKTTNYSFIQTLGIISLCYILFSGALETKLSNVKEVALKGSLLSTVGVLITSLTVGVFVKYITILNWTASFLLGSIIASTDAAAVISILNLSNVKIPLKVKSLLKLESGSNDPVAYGLVIFFLSLNTLPISTNSIVMGIGFLVINIAIGLFLGVIFGKLGMAILDDLSSKIFELDHILIFGLVILTFAVTNICYGNGFLSVYIFGLYLGQADLKYKNNTIRFYSTVSWFMQICMFIALGLLITPLELKNVWKESIVISIILMFVARPLSIYTCLFFKKFKISPKEKIFLSWGGLKGAVPIIFATYPIVQGIDNSLMIFHIVFFVVIFSVLVQGSTLDILAQALQFKKINSSQSISDSTLDLDTLEGLEKNLIEIKVLRASFFKDKQIKDIDFPAHASIASIKRNNSYFMPRGNTVLKEDDILFILSTEKNDFIKHFLAEHSS